MLCTPTHILSSLFDLAAPEPSETAVRTTLAAPDFVAFHRFFRRAREFLRFALATRGALCSTRRARVPRFLTGFPLCSGLFFQLISQICFVY